MKFQRLLWAGFAAGVLVASLIAAFVITIVRMKGC